MAAFRAILAAVALAMAGGVVGDAISGIMRVAQKTGLCHAFRFLPEDPQTRACHLDVESKEGMTHALVAETVDGRPFRVTIITEKDSKREAVQAQYYSDMFGRLTMAKVITGAVGADGKVTFSSSDWRDVKIDERRQAELEVEIHFWARRLKVK
jgi:hypothetical protein